MSVHKQSPKDFIIKNVIWNGHWKMKSGTKSKFQSSDSSIAVCFSTSLNLKKRWNAKTVLLNIQSKRF